jgi:large subunit ribosomal protein L24
MNLKSKIKKSDTVLIRAGKDRGKTAKVARILQKSNQAVITGINILKKHAKPSKKYPKGGIINIQHPVDISNLRLICPHCQKITKPIIKIEKDQKQRLCRRCQKDLDIQPKG